MGKLYLSQSFDVLAKCLADELAPHSFLQKRWILVPNPVLKQWLAVQLALLGEEKIVAGCKICSLEEAIFPKDAPFPNSLEMGCLIYKALHEEWDPELTRFLDGGPRRKLELSDHLAALFFSYGQHGKDFVGKKGDWQFALLERLFTKGSYRLPVQMLPNAGATGAAAADPVHCFGFDFLPEIFWESLASTPSLTVYLFSPCVHFWEDLCTNRERRNLSLLSKKRGTSLQHREEMDNYLSEAPPLLANWGKLGRETLKTLDRFPFEMEEAYASLPEENSALHSLQKEIVFFEKAPRPSADPSIQIFLTGSSRLNEVEVLRNHILQLAEEHRLPFSEIAILAPDIQPYVPLIEFVFSDPAALIPYRFFQVEIGSQSSFYQGIQRLAALAKKNWAREAIIELIETPAFSRRRGWEKEKIERFADWTDAIFKLSSTWEKGFEKTLYRLATLFPEPFPELTRGISIGDSDLLEEFLSLLQSLDADLSPLRTENLRLGDWAVRWEAIADKYLFRDPEEEADTAAWGAFRRLIKELREADLRLDGLLYPFEVIDHFLKRLPYGPIHGSHLHAVRIGSMEPGSILPAKALFLIGMDEESFPRKRNASSLDLLKKEEVYVPNQADINRYLFLQTLFAAQDHLRISYGHLSPDEGKPVGPSILVQELLDSLGPHTASVITSASKRATETEPERPLRFRIHCPEKPRFEPERLVSLADLSLFARHPWKYHLQRELGIYLEDRSERSFPLQRSSILRASLKWPLEKVLSSGSDLPPGIFGDAFRLDVEERAAARQKKLSGALFSLSFLETAREKRRTAADRWEFPPLELELEDRCRVRIVGEANHAIEEGVLHLGDDKLSSLLKTWPETLAASLALGTSRIHFLKNGKTRTIADPEKSLKAFLSYYFRCSSALSPLLPDWANALLRKGPDAFASTTEYEDRVVEWLLPRLEIPSPEVLFSEWGWLRDVFADLTALYPTRSKEAHEEV